MKKLKVLTVVGTRPEIIRLACVLQKLDEAELLGFSRQYQNQIKAELKL